MARVLTVQRATVTRGERAAYLERLRAKEQHYLAAKCRFWVFEESGLPGAFMEFTEADDASTLSAAHASAPERPLDPARIYSQVEID
jgi:hypothetical protein